MDRVVRRPSLAVQVSLRVVADSLDVVPVRVTHEGPVVGRVILGPELWLVQRLGPNGEGGVEEGVHAGAVRGGERDVGLAEAIPRLLLPYPEGQIWKAPVTDGGANSMTRPLPRGARTAS